MTYKTLVGFFMPNHRCGRIILYYLTHKEEDKRVHTSHNGINLKTNAIARLEFEVAYHDVAVQPLHHWDSPKY